MALFHTGNGALTTTSIVALELVNNDWFKRALIGALELMCNQDNWDERGDATADFARDKANEMLEGIQIDVIIPVIPIGVIWMWPTVTIPAKWLKLAGQGINKLTYPELFAIYGYTYGGAGNTFNLPTMVDLLPIGAGSLVSLGADAGSAVAGIDQTNLPGLNFTVTDPGHVHGVTDPGHTHAPLSPATSFRGFHSGGSGGIGAANNGVTNDSPATTASNTTGISVQSHTTGIQVSSGGSNAPFDILNPVRGLNFIIYAGH